MASIVIALVIVAAVAVVAYPFFARWRSEEGVLASGADVALENLIVQRDATYAAIRDLETDHAMGKLSDADYKAIRGKYEGKAVAILQELDAYRAGSASDDEAIEQQVKRLRGETGAYKCPKCGTRARGNDRFCAKCGSALARATA
jgi:rubrerythrin